MTVVVREDVFKDRDNPVDLTIKERAADGTETDKDFSSVTRMVVTILSDTPVTVDSDVDSSAFDYSTNGQVTLTLGSVDVSEGEYYIRLDAYDGSDWTSLIHENDKDYRVKLRFWDGTDHS